MTYYASNGHGTISPSFASGTSTPGLTTGDISPTASEAGTLLDERPITPGSDLIPISQKLRQRTSFARARIAGLVSTRTPASTGLTKEHIEQGGVKLDVYKQYIQAASKTGFSLFLLATILEKAMLALGSFTLRDWGEHNREVGSNTGAMKYLILYGSISLSGSLWGALSSILICVWCSLRSARHLHDGVRTVFILFPVLEP